MCVCGLLKMFYFPWQQSFDIGWKVEKTFMRQQEYGIDLINISFKYTLNDL